MTKLAPAAVASCTLLATFLTPVSASEADMAATQRCNALGVNVGLASAVGLGGLTVVIPSRCTTLTPFAVEKLIAVFSRSS